MEIYLNNPFNDNYIKYFEGNPMLIKDLKRAVADHASQIVIMV